MKKIICLLLIAIMASLFIQAQKKNYLSIDAGLTQSGINNRLAENMNTNRLGARIESSFFFFFILPISYTNQYPMKGNTNSNYKVRYGYHKNEKTSIEGGFGNSAKSWVKGAQVSRDYVNYLEINYNISTAYAAYMWKNNKQNAAIGFGPSVSFCKIRQSDLDGTLYTKKNYILPGMMLTAYWNFINRKSWTLGVRNDMNISMPAKTQDVKITNPGDQGFVSVSKGTNIGSFINTISISGGIKF